MWSDATKYWIRQTLRLSIPTGLLLIALIGLWAPGEVGYGAGRTIRVGKSTEYGFVGYYRTRRVALPDPLGRAGWTTETSELDGVGLSVTIFLTLAALVVYRWTFTEIVRLYPRPVPPNTCARCGYDLRASPDACPECGKPRQESMIHGE